MKQRCPICRKIVNLPLGGGAGRDRFFPFCSERCKLVDLGAWLDAEYRIASKPDEGESDEHKDGPPEDEERT